MNETEELLQVLNRGLHQQRMYREVGDAPSYRREVWLIGGVMAALLGREGVDDHALWMTFLKLSDHPMMRAYKS